jgi:tetratricopeptide (TPR) repeat protein
VFATENFQDVLPDMTPVRTVSSGEKPVSELCKDARTAYEDFKRYGNLEALERAISDFKATVDAIHESHSNLPGALNNLGLLLLCRFERLGQLDDVNKGIEVLRRAVNLAPASHPDKPVYLDILGSSLRLRFERLGNLADAEDAISQHQAAVHLTPDGHPNKPVHLNNLGLSLHRRFERLEDVADIDDAIAQIQAAAHLTPDDHPDKPFYLNSHGSSLHSRFQRLGNLADIDDAIAQTRAAVHLTPDDHPAKPRYLGNFGHYFQSRFRRLGDLADIDDAITHIRAAVHLTPADHPEKSMYLNNLGLSLQTRFKRLENLADLDDAIAQSKAAVQITPDSHPHKPMYLNNLGNSLHLRIRHLGNLTDFDDVISQIQAAVDLTPDDHPQKPMYLNSLGLSLETRFKRLENLADLNDAITQLQSAVHLTPDSHPNKPVFLFSLGHCLQTRFERFNDLDDMNNAIAQHQTAVDLIPDSHPDKTAHLINLANSIRVRFHRLNQSQDAEMAIRLLSAAAMNPIGPASARFRAAERWISIASTLDHPSLLDTYECAVNLIPLVAWLGLPLVARHQHLAKMGGIARDAAAAAISLEQYEKALEWLEQGRSIVWTQILQLRTPVDELREVNPDLADRLLKTSRLLEQRSGPSGISDEAVQSIEEQGRQYRSLTMEWESIIEQVRSLPDFEDFLRPPSSYHLINAARNGPVVVLNIAAKSCDALAILPGLDDIIHIPLPNITSERVTELRDELKDFLHSSGVRSRGKRAAMRVTEEADAQTCQHVLAELWDNLVYPVLSSLAFSVRVSQEHLSKVADSDISSLTQTCFPAFGGAPLDRWPSCLYMQLAYTMENR